MKKAVGRDMEEWRKNRYALFNEKIDRFKDHPKYGWIGQYADEAMSWNEGFGYYMIKAEDFIKRIEQMPLDYIRDWLDGKNQLEWKPEWNENVVSIGGTIHERGKRQSPAQCGD